MFAIWLGKARVGSNRDVRVDKAVKSVKRGVLRWSAEVRRRWKDFNGTYLYKVLGVDKKATIEEIKRAYIKLALEYHPDRDPYEEISCEKALRFKEINYAYGVLSSSTKRQVYDGFGGNFGLEFLEKLDSEQADWLTCCIRWEKKSWFRGDTDWDRFEERERRPSATQLTGVVTSQPNGKVKASSRNLAKNDSHGKGSARARVARLPGVLGCKGHLLTVYEFEPSKIELLCKDKTEP
ncbi:unnamed protein product [Heligmosomoides polygyrus]|uniref:J domain-containing protein n=1 Tax=Heligmosomoides polygyrus TaxID=6339 RepID=A0A183F5Y5_HELPZ|nr:unnamed protein product [Heligmosomoides polygyrus]